MELYAMMEMFYIFTIQHGSHSPPVAIEHFKYGSYNWETEFLILVHVDEFKFR